MHRGLILFIGAIGAAIVVRAGLNYRGDWIALSLVALIGVGLLVGIIEHFKRQQRVEAMRVALNGLPTVCDAEFTPPARLAAWFEAARAGRAAPGLPISATPYLLGAVIMLGMLGTFLGLVQTMAGARALMHDAPDTAALRAGLATPLSGLIRAFGTSVAGIAASVTLGLSALLVRRQERKIRERVQAYIARAFAAQTPTGRQLHALEAVAHAAMSLPAAADALHAAAERLDGVRTEIRAASADAGTAVATAAERAGKEATDAASAAANAASAALVASTDALQQRLDALVNHSESVASRLGTQAAEATANAVGAHLAALAQTLDGHARQRRAAEQEHLRAIRGALDRSAKSFEDRQQAQLTAVSETLAEATHATRTQTVAMSEQLAHEVTTLGDALTRQAQAQTQALDALVARIGDAEALRIRTLDARAADQAETHGAAIDRAVAAMQAQHASQIEALRAEGEALRAREAALAERMAAVESTRGARIAAGQHALLEALRDHAEDRTASEKRTLAEITATLAQQTRVTRAELADLRQAHHALIERFAAAEAERLERLADDEAKRRDTLDAAMQAAEARYAAAEQSRLHSVTAQAEALRAAASDGVQALHAPVQAILDRMEGATLTLAATERQRAAELADRLDAVVGQVQAMASRIDRGEQKRAAALDGTLSRLSTALDTFDAAPVMARMDILLARLDAQQAQASDRFEVAGNLVHQGAELLQSGGAELAAVAEMFAAAVDGYRQASDHSLAALVRVEEALARQDADAAGILREYLDQSREIFGGAMKFQEALFQELRALKGAADG